MFIFLFFSSSLYYLRQMCCSIAIYTLYLSQTKDYKDNWLELDTIIANARNTGRLAALLCTDQSAAFNLVKADIIVTKLRAFGVKESHTFLPDRKIHGLHGWWRHVFPC